MKPRISMITLGVEDLQRSVDFYENGLGLPKMPTESANVAFFTLNGTWLGLYPRHLLAEDATVPDDGSGFKGVTLAHNLASKEEVDAQIQQAIEAGAKLTKPAEDTFWGGYSGYFADPDGHLWEIAWNPHAWVGPEDK
ncbi:VOC family protein [Hahella aquimaris]|uniref:VOC family protein n=1 Tax=Hahella sp. HNIBRBA332 TaxID=3015983 RepID=UPI00273AF3A4|nr:VOC family protein [Hahella sp. HNIBRBA332]WLQ17119.1 VOC family protein [Hahella sp. HNIBRBA332]